MSHSTERARTSRGYTTERIEWLFEGEIGTHSRTAEQAYEWMASLDLARQPEDTHAVFSPIGLLHSTSLTRTWRAEVVIR
jgi:hypothetical protein